MLKTFEIAVVLVYTVMYFVIDEGWHVMLNIDLTKGRWVRAVIRWLIGMVLLTVLLIGVNEHEMTRRAQDLSVETHLLNQKELKRRRDYLKAEKARQAVRKELMEEIEDLQE